MSKLIKMHELTDKLIKKYRVIIFGEMHIPEERDLVESWIRYGRFNVLVSEECGELFAMTTRTLKRAIENKYYSISDRSYKLGLELGIPVIGCDSWDPDTFTKDKKDANGLYTNCKRSFLIREHQMEKVIKLMATGNEKALERRVAVIIGDSHLREKTNKVMGERSVLSLPETFGDDVLIVRSDISEVK